MGTNFYMEAKPACKECGRPHEAKHIGKSSAGWVFSLRVYPEGPRNLEEWIAKFYETGAVIKDEYGKTIAPKDMVERIAGRVDGLLRDRSDNRNPGPGTWDYCEYDFS